MPALSYERQRASKENLSDMVSSQINQEQLLFQPYRTIFPGLFFNSFK